MASSSSPQLPRSFVSSGPSASSSSVLPRGAPYDGMTDQGPAVPSPAPLQDPKRDFLFPKQALGSDAAIPEGSILSAVSTNFGAPQESIVPDIWRSLQRRGATETTLSTSLLTAGANKAEDPQRTHIHVDPAMACDVNIPTSIVSSVVSTWPQHYTREGGIGVTYSRGLIGKDIRMTNSQSAGVCFIKEAKIPDIPKESAQIVEKEKNIAYCETLLRDLGVGAGKVPMNTMRARHSALGGLPRSNSNPASALTTTAVDRVSLRPAVVATARYNSLVLRPPRSPATGLAAGPIAAASTMARSRSLPGLQRQRRLTVNMAPPTGTVADPNYY